MKSERSFSSEQLSPVDVQDAMNMLDSEAGLTNVKTFKPRLQGPKREIGSAVALPMADTPANGFMKQQKRSGWNRASVRRAEAVQPDNKTDVLLPWNWYVPQSIE